MDHSVQQRIGRCSSAMSILIVAALLASMGALSACNTTEGVGKDIESAGEGISDAARDVRDD